MTFKQSNLTLNFCDYCEVTNENAKTKLSVATCQCCNKDYCVDCLPDEYKNHGHIRTELRLNICKHCYHTVLDASCKDGSFDVRKTWGKQNFFDLRASGNSNAIRLGEVMEYIYQEKLKETKEECLIKFKELYNSSKKFLTDKEQADKKKQELLNKLAQM